jgi:hypothetical protein
MTYMRYRVGAFHVLDLKLSSNSRCSRTLLKQVAVQSARKWRMMKAKHCFKM